MQRPGASCSWSGLVLGGGVVAATPAVTLRPGQHRRRRWAHRPTAPSTRTTRTAAQRIRPHRVLHPQPQDHPWGRGPTGPAALRFPTEVAATCYRSRPRPRCPRPGAASPHDATLTSTNQATTSADATGIAQYNGILKHFIRRCIHTVRVHFQEHASDLGQTKRGLLYRGRAAFRGDFGEPLGPGPRPPMRFSVARQTVRRLIANGQLRSASRTSLPKGAESGSGRGGSVGFICLLLTAGCGPASLAWVRFRLTDRSFVR